MHERDRAAANGDELPRLPPGRHGLPRRFVTENQRGRLAAGIIATVAEHGYHETTISQIAANAGVSRRTFYSYFISKEECYLDAYASVADHLAAVIAGAATEDEEWPARVRSRLAALLDSLAANPDLVRFTLVAPPSAGEEIAAPYDDFLARLLDLLTSDRPPSPRGSEPSEVAEQGLIGGLAALLVSKVNADEGSELGALLPDLHELALAPYLGRELAVREAR